MKGPERRKPEVEISCKEYYDCLAALCASLMNAGACSMVGHNACSTGNVLRGTSMPCGSGKAPKATAVAAGAGAAPACTTSIIYDIIYCRRANAIMHALEAKYGEKKVSCLLLLLDSYSAASMAVG